MPAVFLDTAGLLAIASTRDALHAAAVGIWQQMSIDRTPLVTSQWVLSEFLGSMSQSSTRATSLRTIDALVASPRVTVISADETSWAAALTLYRSRPDKEWSLVDCASILACQERAISAVLTADHHFTQAGLSALLA